MTASIVIRPFRPEDARAVSRLIRRVLLEVNSKDYPEEGVLPFVELYTPKTVLELAGEGSTYVAVEGEELLACGSVVPLKTPGEAEIRALFVRPDVEGKGIGREVMAVLETDPHFRSARRVLVSASLTAHLFYEKLGYRYVGGVPVCEDNDHYWMEKVNG